MRCEQPIRNVRLVSSRRRWFEAADHRHATDGRPVGVGDEVRTLCGLTVLVVSAVPGQYAEECAACDRRWRVDEGIPQRCEPEPVRRAR